MPLVARTLATRNDDGMIQDVLNCEPSSESMNIMVSSLFCSHSIAQSDSLSRYLV